MEGSHTPRTPIAAMARTAVAAVRQVPMVQARAATISSTDHQGSPVSPPRSGLRTPLVKWEARSAVPPTTGTPVYRWSTIQSLAVLTGPAIATVRSSGQTWPPATRPATAAAAVTAAARVQPRHPRRRAGPVGSAPMRRPAASVVRSRTTASRTIGMPAASAAPTSTEESAW